LDGGTPFVDIDRVSLTYGGEGSGTLALSDTSLTIGRGEFVAVVGPSGCGKSTLLKLVSGLALATSGRVSVAGRPVVGPLKICGMAFQNATLLPWRTTLDNILLPLEIVEPHARNHRRDREQNVVRAKDLLATVGLAGFEDKYPWQLSGGMQQRSSLDAFTREDLWGVLQTLWLKKKPTVILVTHDLREAVYLADTVYVISARPGRVVSRTAVTLPRPRTLETTYLPEFIDMAHALRDQIAHVRSA
jgi:NitT/TauT family transport system ATP-binding protein